MLRQALAFSVVAALSTAVGCTMCQHPYDQCGPVYDSCGGHPCSPYYRAGSILTGDCDISTSEELTSYPEMVQKQAPKRVIRDDSSLVASIAQDQQPDDVAGSTQIVSVSDRVVEPARTPTESTQTMTASQETIDHQGWTARRPTHDLRR